MRSQGSSKIARRARPAIADAPGGVGRCRRPSVWPTDRRVSQRQPRPSSMRCARQTATRLAWDGF